MSATSLTSAQRCALLWLRNRRGTGVFGTDQVLIAAGERAGVMRSTWNALRDAGYVRYQEPRRVYCTATGMDTDLGDTKEATTVE